MIKKAIFFFPENPFSNRAGNVKRAFSTLNILKKIGYEIDLVGSKDVYQEMSDKEYFDKNVVNTLFLISKKPNKKNILVYLKYKFKKKINKPFKYNGFLSSYTIDSFEKILSQKKYDLIFVNYETWAPLVHNTIAKQSKLIIDTHDWMTLNNFYNNPKIDIGEKFGEEIKNLSFFNHIVTISIDEYFIFKSFLGKKVINIPPGFPDKTENETLKFSEKKYDLIFVGSDNPFNIKALKWFFETVFPLIKIKTKICVIGRICNHIPDFENLDKIIYAEDLDGLYYNSKVALCPMLEGTGIKIKVVEALSYGLPVIGTTKTVDGFLDKNANGCITADNPLEFASNIEIVLSNQEFYDLIKNQSKTYFKEHFMEDKIAQSWKSILM
ncbi:glycosyltransferase [Epilithonimonas xixisoli]|uniref:Glycosyltransferase involved in cell wall biosynthesis n=1 Tax=Epilithonimonas xixisoli TaxID=1476462 RepID=A0A4R8I3U6_9FLAO|nr:glycosyltransferase [Epilithonimonas xixisoli]TDX82630.1 glycosyltransferase involved in cell wall biosynthesis [Epilithonimonas xixisoli]